MLSKETVKFFDTYMSYIAIFTLPGLAAMDYAFGRGLFSGGIDNIYNFVLLIIWSISLSVPFLALVVRVLRPHDLHQRGDPYGASFTTTANSALLYVGMLTLINYALFNACEYYFGEHLERLVILDVRIALVIVSGIGTFISAYPLAWIYKRWIRWIRSEKSSEG